MAKNTASVKKSATAAIEATLATKKQAEIATHIATGVYKMVQELNVAFNLPPHLILDHLLLDAVDQTKFDEAKAAALPADAEILTIDTASWVEEAKTLFPEAALVSVKWDEDGKWYDAQIVKHKMKKGKVVVQFAGEPEHYEVDSLDHIKELTAKGLKRATEAFGLNPEPKKEPFKLNHEFRKGQTVRIAMGRGKKSVEAEIISVNNEQAQFKIDGEKVAYPVEALRTIAAVK